MSSFGHIQFAWFILKIRRRRVQVWKWRRVFGISALTYLLFNICCWSLAIHDFFCVEGGFDLESRRLKSWISYFDPPLSGTSFHILQSQPSLQNWKFVIAASKRQHIVLLIRGEKWHKITHSTYQRKKLRVGQNAL